MSGPGDGVYRWVQPPAGAATVLLIGAAAAVLLALTVLGLVVENYDFSAVCGVLGLAAAADLYRDLRPRAFVIAGEQGVVVRTGRRTTTVAWSEVAGLRPAGRWRRPAVEHVDGTRTPLPHEVALAELRHRRPDGPSDTV